MILGKFQCQTPGGCKVIENGQKEEIEEKFYIYEEKRKLLTVVFIVLRSYNVMNMDVYILNIPSGYEAGVVLIC